MPFENVPEELRKLRQWILWRLETRDGKPTKVPYQCNAVTRASSTDPTTWKTFGEATGAFAAARKKVNGVGFVFTAQTGLVGVDLDKCRNPKTGEIEPWAKSAVDELASYTEISQSGTGLHIFVRGVKPSAKCRNGRVEIYSTGRYFATTGDILPGSPSTISKRDLTDFQNRILSSDAPKADAVPKKSGEVDQSAEDFKIVGQVYRETKITDAAELEKKIAELYPDQYKAAIARKGTRATPYWKVTVESFLKDKPQTITVDESEVKELDEENLPEFPKIPGPLGKIIDGITPDCPYEYKALCAITYAGLALSGFVRLSGEPWQQPRFYSLMIGPPETGKGASFKEVDAAMRDACQVRVIWSIESGPALVQAISGSNHLLLFSDEMADTFEMAKLPGRGLFGQFLTLYDSNRTANITKKTKDNKDNVCEVTDGHFAMIGGVQDKRFMSMFQGTNAAASGLLSRFDFAYSDRPWPRIVTPNNSELIMEGYRELNQVISQGRMKAENWKVYLTAGAEFQIDIWPLPNDESAKRHIEIAKRFAMVVAATTGKDAIDDELITLGLRFADYRAACWRRFVQPDVSGHVDAMEKRIARFFAKNPGSFSQNTLQKAIAPHTLLGGLEAWNRAWLALNRAEYLVKTGAKNRKNKPLFAWRNDAANGERVA